MGRKEREKETKIQKEQIRIGLDVLLPHVLLQKANCLRAAGLCLQGTVLMRNRKHSERSCRVIETSAAT